MQRPGEHSEARVLAIDHSVLIHRLLKARLRPERLEVHSTTTAVEGLRLAKSLDPDAILLDLDLPDGDGFHVLTSLKADSDTHNTPVVILSANSNCDDRVRALELGAIDFIAKPFDFAELRARVRNAVRLQRMMKMLSQRAQIDGLTGLWNRGYFDERLQQEIKAAIRHRTPLSLMICDLDHFKKINDAYGHPFGDQVLEEFAGMLQGGRESDIACRYGGEEFAVIMPHCTSEQTLVAAERVGKALIDTEWERDPALRVSVSIGIAELPLTLDSDPAALVRAADRALYEAKQNGRNQIALAPMPGDAAERKSA